MIFVSLVRYINQGTLSRPLYWLPC